MKKFLLATALVALGSAASAQDVVRVATEGAYEPYNFTDQATGKIIGLDIDVVTEACKRAALTCEFVQSEWDPIIPNLLAGNYDAIAAGMSITPERQKDITFSAEYFPASVSSYLALSDDANIGEGAIIAAQAQTMQAGFVAGRTDVTLLEFATADETISAVRNGEADAVLADREYLVNMAEASNGELVILEKTEQIGGGIGIGLRKSDTELKDKLDKALVEMRADGTLNTMIAKWFVKDPNLFKD